MSRHVKDSESLASKHDFHFSPRYDMTPNSQSIFFARFYMYVKKPVSDHPQDKIKKKQKSEPRKGIRNLTTFRSIRLGPPLSLYACIISLGSRSSTP
jgi:hypothetical protein